MTDQKDLCHHCRAAPDLQRFATTLQETELNQLKGPNPPLRDDTAYSVTGLASELLTFAIWIHNGRQWHYHNINHFHEDIYKTYLVRDTQTGAVPQEHHLTQDQYSSLVNQIGTGDVETCPEETLCALGLEHHTTQGPIQYLDKTGKFRNLDDLDFKTAGQMLTVKPQLISQCTCEVQADR